MQYIKLGFSRLLKGCGSHQVPCSLIENRSVIPTLHSVPRSKATAIKEALHAVIKMEETVES